MKNTFVDDGDIQLVTNRIDRNTYCIICGGNFVYIFSFKKIEPYSLIEPLMNVPH